MPLPVILILMVGKGGGIREDTQCLASRGACVDPEAEDVTT